MPARPGQPFQPVLPGMGRVRKAAPPVTHEPQPVWNDRRGARMPGIPGQTVMGVRDLADQDQHRNIFGGSGTRGVSDGPYELNEHGYVREGTGLQGHDQHGSLGSAGGGGASAWQLYGTHGGRYAKTMSEQLDGQSPSDMGLDSSDVQDHDHQVKQVKAHWAKIPVTKLATDALVHTSQSVEETEGDPEDIRMTRGPRQRWTATPKDGQPHGHMTNVRMGGTTMMTDVGHEVTGSGDGRKSIEKIKTDLRAGRQIRKPIWMAKVNGRLHQLDGHHRMVAAREAGVSHVPVKVWDIDAERAGGRTSRPHEAVIAHAVSRSPALGAHLTAQNPHRELFDVLKDLAGR